MPPKKAKLSTDSARRQAKCKAVHKASERAVQGDEQKNLRLLADRTHHAEARAIEDEKQRQQRQQDDRTHHAEARAIEDEQQRQQRQQDDRKRHAEAQAIENEQQRQQRQQDNRKSHAEARATEDHQHRQQRLLAYAARYKHARAVGHHRGTHSLDEYVSGALSLPAAFNIGSMTVSCSKCDAKMWSKETHTGSINTGTVKFSTCCSQGKVQLPKLASPPDILKGMLTQPGRENTMFRNNIRAYNSSLAFTSLGVNEKHVQGHGPPIFKIQGTVYHRIGQLLPEVGDEPKFSQMLIYDVNNELHNRMKWNDTLQESIMEQLQTMLHEVNPYIEVYKHAAEAMNEAGAKACDVRLVLKDTGRDPRRYNLPTTSDVAVILPGSGEEPGNRDIVLYRRAADDPGGHTLKKINECHRMYDPLHYILLFPRGDTGWKTGIPLTGSIHQMSPMQFYAHRLMERPEFSTIHHGGRLFQQYAVDMYAKIETQRLTFHRFNQDILHAELYQGLFDAVNTGDTGGETVGRLIVLPATFTGSPRSMHQQYQDAMGIVRRFGKPDLFITMTCNPGWPEIKEALDQRQTASDRPDIVARVFMMKKKQLVDELTKKHVLGKIIAYVNVVEFQKRGLPHLHMLAILASEDKPRSSDDYDKFVCAEIPDKDCLPALHTTVTSNMMHGPCGHLNKGCPCMKDGKCSKGYPKSFSEVSKSNENGYPVYRRRDGGNCILKTVNRPGGLKEKIPLDNRWVVPYNPYLAALFDAHINVEICNSVRSVKYLYKYIYKGNDRITAEIKQHPQKGEHQGPKVINEIDNYVDGRYITPQEGCWRIFHYSLQDKSPAIQRLPVHLEGQHLVIFPEGGAAESLENAKDTALMAWFKTNQKDPAARTLLYSDFPEHYTWNPASAQWKPRKSGYTIGRMCTASPSQEERYCLRLLLTRLPGRTSYDDLRTLEDGTVCPTYKEAALKRGMLESDIEWDSCLREASLYKMPAQLRHLFAIILVFGGPAKPGKLWDDHKATLCEDIQHERNGDTGDPSSDVINSALLDIERHLQIHGKHLSDHQGAFPEIHEEQPASHLIREFTSFSTHEQGEKASQNLQLMNSDQRDVYDEVMAAVANPGSARKTVFFIDGPGGTGKTFTYNTLAATLRSQNQTVIAVATSGIAAEMLDIARTAHSAFKIPIPIQKSSTCDIGRNTDLAKLIKQTCLIIFDEAPMANKEVIECLDRSLSDVTGCAKPFGGIVIVFGGDFRQVLPIVRHGSRAAIVNASIKRSLLWKRVRVLKLTVNMRAAQSGDATFPEYLLRIGDGVEPTCINDGDDDDGDTVILPVSICLQSEQGRLQDLINKVSIKKMFGVPFKFDNKILSLINVHSLNIIHC